MTYLQGIWQQRYSLPHLRSARFHPRISRRILIRKKIVALPQYLPSCDPGSTYTGGSGIMSGLEDESRRRKRPRLDKRAQRASARTMAANHQNLESHLQDPPTQGGPEDPLQELPRGEGSSRLRGTLEVSMTDASNSEPPESRILQRPSRRRGKAEEVATRQFIPEAVESEGHVLGHKSTIIAQANQDHCSACRSIGSLLYCDSCPRAYHLWCLNPPLNHSDIPGPGLPWDCPACNLEKNPKPPPRKRFMSELITTVQNGLPCEFSLPEDIRSYFKNVGTGPRGSYTDNVSTKPRLNRLGFPEDRDPYRLRDRNGSPVLCFRCGKTALPTEQPSDMHRIQRSRAKNSVPGTEDTAWKRMLSCDFCSSSWHLDCLDPPLTTMPSIMKKWMCPNHAEQTISNRRQPKVNLHPKEVRSTGARNKGLIEIIPSNDVHARNTVAVDEVLINSRIYRVPERVIILDFWGKIRSRSGTTQSSPIIDSGGTASSPLTSLSSPDEVRDDLMPLEGEEGEALSAAQVLCALPSLPNGHRADLTRNSNNSGYPSSFTVKAEITTPVLSKSAIPSSPLSVLSELTPESEEDEVKSTLQPEPNARLKIRIPRPLNIAVASASRAAKQSPAPPRRSLRSTSSVHKPSTSTSQGASTQGNESMA